MEVTYELAVVQSGPMMIRLFALFGLIMLLIFAYNLLFKGNFVLMFIFPAQLLVPFAVAAYFMSFFYLSYGSVYYPTFSGAGFFLSYWAAIFLQKSYERVVKGNPQPFDKPLIIICGCLTFAFAIYLMWAIMGYNFFYGVYDFFLNLFRWLGLVPASENVPYRGRGSINPLFLLLGHPQNPLMRLVLPLLSKVNRKLRNFR